MQFTGSHSTIPSSSYSHCGSLFHNLGKIPCSPPSIELIDAKTVVLKSSSAH
jgi:hypothetical protein